MPDTQTERAAPARATSTASGFRIAAAILLAAALTSGRMLRTRSRHPTADGAATDDAVTRAAA